MPKIHVAGSVYTPPSPISGFEWRPFTAAHHLSTVRSAVAWIEHHVVKHLPCGKQFKALPDGRSFKEVWEDSSIWLSYCGTTTGATYGGTVEKKHVAICLYALRKGRPETAATIIHELAHCNGAGSSDNAAEATLKSCLLKKYFSPTIIGELELQRARRPEILT